MAEYDAMDETPPVFCLLAADAHATSSENLHLGLLRYSFAADAHTAFRGSHPGYDADVRRVRSNGHPARSDCG